MIRARLVSTLILLCMLLPPGSALVYGQGTLQIIDATGDGAGNTLNSPVDIAVDNAGNAFVTGSASDNVFRITPAGDVTMIIDASGDGAGNGLDSPFGIAVDAGGNVYVSGELSDNVFKISPGGVITEIIDFAGDGGGNGLDGPLGIAVDGAGNVYVVGATSDNAFKITPGGVITELIDASGDGGGNGLDQPFDVKPDAAGNVYVSGEFSSNVFKITSQGTITEVIDGSGDGAGSTLAAAQGIDVDGFGNVFVSAWSSVNAFKITPGGVIAQIFDTTGDGAGNDLMIGPFGMAVDAAGNAYVTGGAVFTGKVFRIEPIGTVTLVVDSAGDGNGNNLIAARGVDTDSAGSLYVVGRTSDNAFRVSFGPPADCNANGIPDPCDLSCGPAGGFCDVAGCGASVDCNGNGVPDDCDLADCQPDIDPACDDCNLNGIPDGCDIDAMTSQDADANNVPDECEVFAGGCPLANIDWTCPDNWDLAGGYPDNIDSVPNLHITLNGMTAFLDEDVEIDTLRLRSGAELRAVQVGEQGDLTTVDPGGILLQGTMMIGDGRVIEVMGGPLVVGAGGVLQSPSGVVANASAVRAAAAWIKEGACGQQGQVSLTHDMGLSIGGTLLFTGGDDGGQDPGCCPPEMSVLSAAHVDADRVVLDGSATVLYGSSEPFILRGDFSNNSPEPEGFDWLSGAMCLGSCGLNTGLSTHAFEAAGMDIGAVAAGYATNFAIGRLEIDSSAATTVMDDFDNDGQGQAPCTEALYVGTLVLRAGSSITLTDSNVYYGTLIDEGGSTLLTGCGTLQQAMVGPDLDGNGIRDDNCLWWTCDAGSCTSTPINYGDMGGAFGSCMVDGFTNIHDRNHVLSCFAGTNSCDAINIDTGSAFGACPPDGFCNIHDANHALAVFANASTCSCPAPPLPELTPAPVGTADIIITSTRRAVEPGGTIEVRVFGASRSAVLRSYQLELEATGGRSGRLDVVDIRIEPRKDWVFADMPGTFDAVNIVQGLMLAGLNDNLGIRAIEPAYLATYSLQASRDAAGTFLIDLATRGETYLVAPHDGRIDIVRVVPVAVSTMVVSSRTR